MFKTVVALCVLIFAYNSFAASEEFMVFVGEDGNVKYFDMHNKVKVNTEIQTPKELYNSKRHLVLVDTNGQLKYINMYNNKITETGIFNPGSLTAHGSFISFVDSNGKLKYINMYDKKTYNTDEEFPRRLIRN